MDTRTFEEILAAGQETLAAQREKERQEREEREAKARKCNEDWWAQFRLALGEIIPEQAMAQIDWTKTDDPDYWPSFWLSFPDCVPIRMDVLAYAAKVVRVQLVRYEVCGVSSTPPFLGHDDLCPPEIGTSTDPSDCDMDCSPFQTMDLDLAIAVAAEHHAYMLARGAFMAERLEVLEAELAARPPKQPEPRYEAMEGDRVDALLNKPELVRMIRDLIDEALDERW